jgi:hypothetical protein|nr:MAG TPA: hypothetical protein [Caudoviricetes sp.]
MSETFINYSDLDFKQEDTDKYTVITFKDKEIKVLKYLPSIEKYNLLNTTLLQSIDDTVIINEYKLDMFFNINLAIAYTNIVFSKEEQDMELSDLYDKFKTSGLLDMIIDAIPDDEYATLYSSLVSNKEEYVSERKSVSYGIANAIEQISKKLPKQEEMQNLLQSLKDFNPEDYSNVVEFAKAANGGRDITE